jgi:molybdate transport system substrate-binding protein
MRTSPVKKIIHRALCASFGMLAIASALHAEELFVLSAAAVEAPLREVVRSYEKSTGNHVKFEFSTAGGVESKLRAGAKADVVINTQGRMDTLASAGLLSPGIKKLGTVRMGVAVRKGGRHPDISSAEAFRASLLKAESVAYGNPEKGATSGIHFDKVLQRLGVADAVRPKAILEDDGVQVMRAVVKGDAELGVTQISEIKHIAPETLVGPLPEELQLASVYSVGVSPKASKAAAQLADLLAGTEARESFRHAGFD